MIVDVNDYRDIVKIRSDSQKELPELVPSAVINVKTFLLGPGDGGKIQLRISGPDYQKVRELANKAMKVIHEDGEAVGVRHNWMQMTKVVRPQLLEAQARKVGLERPAVAQAFQQSFIGTPVGVYREKEDLLQIMARAPEGERTNADNFNDMEIWSPAAQKMMPMRQIVSEFKTEYENARIMRRNRMPTLTIHCDAKEGLASVLLERIKPKIEEALNVDVGQVLEKDFDQDEDPFSDFNDKTLSITYQAAWPLKDLPGYSMGWDGEAEDSTKAQDALSKTIPILLDSDDFYFLDNKLKAHIKNVKQLSQFRLFVVKEAIGNAPELNTVKKAIEAISMVRSNVKNSPLSSSD